MLAQQGGQCAICKGPPAGRDKFYVDHCHETGAVRGLLCIRCNTLIGSAKENETILVSAIAYIRRHRLKRAA
jgi:hypothetical protein